MKILAISTNLTCPESAMRRRVRGARSGDGHVMQEVLLLDPHTVHVPYYSISVPYWYCTIDIPR
eukprot:COSAG02_NODE_786_length_17199_cov_25.278889_14_plen_64_part_00